MEQKIFVLDTNVLLHDQNCLHAFSDNKVIIPIVALEELDSFKKRQDEVGRNARQISRQLDELRGKGSLVQGVELPSGGTLQILLREVNHDKPVLMPLPNPNTVDNRILALALSLQSQGEVIFISKDINLRVKANALGLNAEDYITTHHLPEELFQGVAECDVSGEVIDRIHQDGSVEVSELGREESVPPNQFLVLKDLENPKHTALGRCAVEGNSIDRVNSPSEPTYGIKALNKEQQFALELLLDPKVVLVTLLGIAGTGKTLLALAAGLQQVVHDDRYRRLLVSRPVIPMGKDLGYLPGDLQEKLMPWMQPIHDALEFLFSARYPDDESERTMMDLIEAGIVELEALSFIRGRSLPNQYLIVDEAQNLTPLEVKTIVTRAGTGTKIVLTGDPYQIDHPYLDSRSNGLCYIVDRMMGSGLYGHVTLSKGERSPLAALAAERL